MTAVDERVGREVDERGAGPAGSAGWEPDRCDRHGGPLPSPAPGCPECGGSGPGDTSGAGGAGSGADGQGAGAPAAGPPPLIEYDPEAVTAAATAARLAADGIESALTARGSVLATTTGELALVAALARAATASAARARLLATDVSALSANLGLAVADYARVDDDLAAAFDALVPA